MLWIKKNLNCYQLHRSIMVFMELVYMVLNSDANWLNNSDECYKLNAITVMQEQREDWIIIVIKKCSVEIWHSGINESKIFIRCNLAQIIVQNIDMQTQNSPLLSQIAKYLSVDCLELWNNLMGGGITLLSMLCRVYPWQLTWSRDQ